MGSLGVSAGGSLFWPQEAATIAMINVQANHRNFLIVHLIGLGVLDPDASGTDERVQTARGRLGARGGRCNRDERRAGPRFMRARRRARP
jgi:hypothetical protein